MIEKMILKESAENTSIKLATALNTEINTLPKLVIAGADYEISLLIKEFIQNKNLASVLEILRDGIEALDFLKSLKIYSFKLKCIILNYNIFYLDELMTGIDNDQNLKVIPLIIFSDFDKKFISDKYSLNDKSFVLNPMQLPGCEEIINNFNKEEFSKEPILSGKRTSYLL